MTETVEVIPEQLRPGYYFGNLYSLPFAPERNKLRYVWDLLKEKKTFLSSLKSENRGEIQQGAFVSGPVHIGEGSIVHSGAIVRGPVWIGQGCSIRWHSVVRDGSVLCDNVVVGHGGEVKDSILMNGAKMQGTYCGNSIMGEQSRVSSGSVFENRKFNRGEIVIGPLSEIGLDHKIPTGLDFFGCILGDQSRLGGVTTTFPGTLIGQHTWAYGQQHLRGFIPSNVLVKEGLEIIAKNKVTLDSGFDDYEWR
jgi:bifunctional UDP-N-acetylglucosamine pyrophosphorylase/glucosamine-1-phosphate N-acetyltransferase